MQTERRKLVTIVTETSLEQSLVQELEELGAHGHTVTDARGRGHRGMRSAGWDLSGNIRIEVVCDEPTSVAIAERLRERYYDNYAMILFVSDVDVLRPGKF